MNIKGYPSKGCQEHAASLAMVSGIISVFFFSFSIYVYVSVFFSFLRTMPLIDQKKG